MDLKEPGGKGVVSIDLAQEKNRRMCVCVCVCGDHGNEKSYPVKCEEFHPSATSLKVRATNNF